MNKRLFRAGKLPAPPRNVTVKAAKCGEIEVRWDPAPEEARARAQGESTGRAAAARLPHRTTSDAPQLLFPPR